MLPVAYITYRAVNQVLNYHNYFNHSTFSSTTLSITTFSSASTNSGYPAVSISSAASRYKPNRTTHYKHRRRHLKALSSCNSSSSKSAIFNIVHPQQHHRHHHTLSSPSLAFTSDSEPLENSENSAPNLPNYDLTSANSIFRRIELIYPSVCVAVTTSSISASNTTTTADTLVPRLVTQPRSRYCFKRSSALSCLLYRNYNKMAPGPGEKRPPKGRTTASRRKAKAPEIESSLSDVLNLSTAHQRHQNVVVSVTSGEEEGDSSSHSSASFSDINHHELHRQRQLFSHKNLLLNSNASPVQTLQTPPPPPPPSTSPLQRSLLQQTLSTSLDYPSLIFRKSTLIQDSPQAVGESEEMALAQYLANQQQLAQGVPVLNVNPRSAVLGGLPSSEIGASQQTLDDVFQENLALLQSSATLRSKLRHLNELVKSCPSINFATPSSHNTSDVPFWTKVQQNSTPPTFTLNEIPQIFFMPSTNVTALTKELDRITGEVVSRRDQELFNKLTGFGQQLPAATTIITSQPAASLPIQNQSLLNLQYLQNLEQQQQQQQQRNSSQRQQSFPSQQLSGSNSALPIPSRDAATTTTAAVTATTTTVGTALATHRAPESGATAARASGTAAAVGEGRERSTIQRTESAPVSAAPRTASFSTPPVATSLAGELRPIRETVEASPPLVSTAAIERHCLVSNTTSSAAALTVVAPSAAASGTESGTVPQQLQQQQHSQWQPSLKGQLQGAPMALSGTSASTALPAQPPPLPPLPPLTPSPSARPPPPSARAHPRESVVHQQGTTQAAQTLPLSKTATQVRPPTAATCSRPSDQSGHNSSAPPQMNPPNPRQMAASSAAAAAAAVEAVAHQHQYHQQQQQQQQQQQLFALINQQQNQGSNNNAIAHSQLQLQLQLLQSNFLLQHPHPHHPQANIINPLLAHSSAGVLSTPPLSVNSDGMSTPTATSTTTTTAAPISPFLHQSVMISSAPGDSGLPNEQTAIDNSLRLLFANDTTLSEQQRQLINGAIFQLQQQQQQQHKVQLSSDSQSAEQEQPENLQLKQQQLLKQQSQLIPQQLQQLQHLQTLQQSSPYLFGGSPSPTGPFHLLPPQLMSTPPLPPSTSAYSMERILSPVADSAHHSYHHHHQAHHHHHQQQPPLSHSQRPRPEKVFEMSDDERSSLASNSSGSGIRSQGPEAAMFAGTKKESPGGRTSVLVMAAGKTAKPPPPARSSVSSSSQRQSTASCSSSSDSIASESLDLSTSRHSSEKTGKSKQAQQQAARKAVFHSYPDSSEVVHSQVGGSSRGKASTTTDENSNVAESGSDCGSATQQQKQQVSSLNQSKLLLENTTTSSSNIDFSRYLQNSALTLSGEMLLSPKKSSILATEAKDLRISKHQSLSAIVNLQENKFHQKAVKSTKDYIDRLFDGSNSPVLPENLSNSDQVILGNGDRDSDNERDDKSKINNNNNNASDKGKKDGKTIADSVNKDNIKSESSVVVNEPTKESSLLEKTETQPKSASLEYFKKMLTERKTPKGGIRGKKTVLVKESLSSSSSSSSS